MKKKKAPIPWLKEHAYVLLFWIAVLVLGVLAFLLPLRSLEREEPVLQETVPFQAKEKEILKKEEVAPPLKSEQPLADTQDLSSLALVKKYFRLYNTKEFQAACALLPDSKCNEDNPPDVTRFSEESGKQVNGYEDLKFWMASIPEDVEKDVVCIQYSFKYKFDAKDKKIQEIMSFYIGETEEGKKEIIERVCEKKTIDDTGETPCPTISKRDFCRAD